MNQTAWVDVVDVALSHRRSAQLCGVGPDDGDVVLYFHSPATSGEELYDAAGAAAELRLRLLCVKRPTIECTEANRFVDTVADNVAAITETLELENMAILAWSGGAPWTFDVGSVTQPVTIWSPTEDEIVPPVLIGHLHERLQNADTTSVSGGHDWLTQNWQTVLARVPL